LLLNYLNLCLKCRPIQWFKRDVTADSSINNQLIKLHSTHSWIERVLSLSVTVTYFVAIFGIKHLIPPNY